MDNFTNKNSQNKRRSIDGFTPNLSNSNRGSINFDRPRTQASQPQPRRIDDFRRPEGLRTPLSGGVASSPAEPSTLPVKSEMSLKSQPKPPAHSLAKQKRRRRLKIAAIGSIVVLVIGLAGFAYLKSIFGGGGGAAALQENIDPSKLRGEGDGRVNILLMGRGGEGAEAPDLTDTMIVLSIDPINHEAGLVSIPRDLYVTVPNVGAMKINQVFYTGKHQVLDYAPKVDNGVKKQADEKGYELAKSSVEQVLGIPIHYRGLVDFTGFKEAVDTVGGIDVNVPKRVYEHMRFDGKPYVLDVKKGPKHFEGFDALAYARSRYTSSGGDFDRSERQRLMILALKDKVLSAGTFTNPAKVAQLLDNFSSHVQTDFNLQDLNRLQDIFRQIDSNKIDSIGLVDPPHDFLTTTMVGGLSVVLPKAGADNYEAIHKYIRNTLKDGYLKSENANVMVLNGTQQEGLATAKAEELRSYGYNVGTVDNAPNRHSYPSTMVIDLRNGEKKYTKRYLEQRFGTLATGSLPDSSIQTGSADFIIILGNDARGAGN